MDNGTQNRMTLERMTLGGFVVQADSVVPGTYNAPIFASTTIDEALKFIRAAMNPIGPQEGGKQS